MSESLRLAEQKSYKKRKITALLTILSIILCFGVIFSPVFADDDDEETVFDDDETIWDFFEDEYAVDTLIYPYSAMQADLMTGAFINDSIDKFYTDEVMDAIIDGITGEESPVMGTFTMALKSVAIFFIFITVIVATLKEVEHGEMTEESLLKILVALCLPVVLIIEYDTILELLTGIGVYFHDLLRTSTPHASGEIAVERSVGLYGENNKDLDFSILHPIASVMEYIVACMKSFILVGAEFIINLLIIMIIISGVMSNYVEIGLRHIFMPLAIANVAHDGMRSAGMRYIKRYLGCFMKVGAIMAAVELAFYVYDKIILADPNILEQLILLILLMPLIKQSIKMCNEIITEAMGD